MFPWSDYLFLLKNFVKIYLKRVTRKKCKKRSKINKRV